MSGQAVLHVFGDPVGLVVVKLLLRVLPFLAQGAPCSLLGNNFRLPRQRVLCSFRGRLPDGLQQLLSDLPAILSFMVGPGVPVQTAGCMAQHVRLSAGEAAQLGRCSGLAMSFLFTVSRACMAGAGAG